MAHRTKAKTHLAAPMGRRKKKRLPLPLADVAPMAHTLNRRLVLRYFSIMPLQLSSPKPWPLYILRSNTAFRSSSVMPHPLSLTDISTYPSCFSASMATIPPCGVNLRALSASVFSMNSVSTLSAFTTASVSPTASLTPFMRKLASLFATIANSGANWKVSMRRLSCPVFICIHSVST